MKLHHSQERIYFDILTLDGDVLYEMPTGSGKTLIVLCHPQRGGVVPFVDE
jgi:replicative superfamily II helicase